jgi:hypothetical protein
MKPPRPDVVFPLMRKKVVTVDWGQWSEPALSPAQKAVYEALWAEEPQGVKRHYYAKI